VYRYIQAEKAHDPESRVAVMCRVLGVSRSGYYDWCRRFRRPARGRHAEKPPAQVSGRHTVRCW